MAVWLLFLPLFAFASPPLETYLSLQFRAEAALQDFDRVLEESEGPGLLLRSRAYKELLALRHLLEELEEGLSLEKIPPLNPPERIAAHDLMERSGKPLFPSQQAYLRFKERHRKAFQARVEESRTRHEAEIRSMLDTLGLTEASLTTIRPSPGPDGNITGYAFPERTWALTYDDGPSPRHTLPILDLLGKFSVRATFFWVAQNLPGKEEIVARVKDAGMALANHSYTHANLPKVDADTLRREVVASTELQEKFYGERPRFFRCPYGAGMNTPVVRRLIADTGMIHVFWNVDSLDWQDKDPASVLARVKAQMNREKKGVILFHDIHAQTVEASRLLLEYSAGLKGNQALRWVTLPEIVDELNRRN